MTYLLIICQNVFAKKLGPFGLDHYVMLVVDLMHEFELGVWKAIFTHLIRLLYVAGPGGWLVTELDRRYNNFTPVKKTPDEIIRFRLVPTFGRSTIRHFSSNASEMKKLAARNYEDLLQVRMQLTCTTQLTTLLVCNICI